jgi:signal transduction histidine kinase
MKRRDAVAAMVVGTLIVLALLAVFAIELSANQARSRSDIESQAHQRATLVANLIDTVFAAESQPTRQILEAYGTPTVPSAVLDRARGVNNYVVLLDSAGNVIAASSGFNAQARAAVTGGAVAMVQRGHAWAIGDIRPYATTGVIDFATRLPTAAGTRILVTGFAPAALSQFMTSELRQVPGVEGAHHFVLDGNGVVIASNDSARPLGYVFHTPTQLDVLHHRSGIVKGHYFDQVPLANTSWRVVLAAPEAPFFASVSGAIHWLPWVIFGAFALVALVALVLARRAVHASDLVAATNAKLEHSNAKLEESNAELERRARELARSNAELNQFASIASHDLQEPLRKVRTFTERVKETDGEHLSERGRDYLERAGSAAERMQRLVEDLLKFSRVATGAREFEPVDLGRVTAEVLSDLEESVQSTGAVVRVGPLPTINADPSQMRQLLQNLISNSLKFTREGVTPEIDIEATVHDGCMKLVVRDNGIGFDSRYGRRIFRVFERLHGRSAYPGTGIGLALCRKIAERHGGTVVAEAVPDRGATFTVIMQVELSEAVLEDPPAGPERPEAEQKEPYVAV